METFWFHRINIQKYPINEYINSLQISNQWIYQQPSNIQSMNISTAFKYPINEYINTQQPSNIQSMNISTAFKYPINEYINSLKIFNQSSKNILSTPLKYGILSIYINSPSTKQYAPGCVLGFRNIALAGRSIIYYSVSQPCQHQ